MTVTIQKTATTSFGERLEIARKERGLSMAELGRRCEWDTARISHYEADRIEPRISTVYVLATALSVPPGWLAFGSDR